MGDRWGTAKAVLRFLEQLWLATIDTTVGTPALHSAVAALVDACIHRPRHVMERCNLIVLLKPGRGHLMEFLQQQGIELLHSLPCSPKVKGDHQRGKGIVAVPALLWPEVVVRVHYSPNQ